MLVFSSFCVARGANTPQHVDARRGDRQWQVHMGGSSGAEVRITTDRREQEAVHAQVYGTQADLLVHCAGKPRQAVRLSENV